MDFSPLLILLFGAVVGWCFKHWRTAGEVAELRRQIQYNRAAVVTVRQSASADPVTASPESTALASNASTTLVDTNVGGVESDSVSTQSTEHAECEIGELYRVCAQVKPLEFELTKTREELERLKAMRGSRAHSISARSKPLAIANTHTTGHTVTNKAMSFAGGEFRVMLTQNEEQPDEVGELYTVAAKVKPLEYEVSRLRKSNNAIAADKERLERKLRRQLEQQSHADDNTVKMRELQSKVNRLEESHSTIASLENKLSSRTKELHREQTRVRQSSGFEAKYYKARDDLDRQTTHINNLTLQIDDQKLNVNSLEARLAESSKESAKGLSISSALQQTVVEREKHIDSLSAQLDEASKKLASVQLENTQLANEAEAKLEAQAKAHTHLQQTATQTNQQLSEVQEQFTQVSKNNDALERQKADLLRKVEQAEDQLKTSTDLQQASAKKEAEFEAQAIAYAAAQRDSVAKDEKLLAQTKAFTALQEQATRTNQQLKELQARYSDQSQRYESLDREKLALLTQFEEAETRLEASAGIKQAADASSAKLEALTAAYALLEQKSAQANQQNQSLQSQLKGLSDANDSLQRKKAEVLAKFEQAETRLKASEELQSASVEKDSQLEAQARANEELQLKASQADQQLVELEGQIKQLTRQNESLRQDNASTTEKLAHTESQLKDSTDLQLKTAQQLTKQEQWAQANDALQQRIAEQDKLLDADRAQLKSVTGRYESLEREKADVLNQVRKAESRAAELEVMAAQAQKSYDTELAELQSVAGRAQEAEASAVELELALSQSRADLQQAQDRIAEAETTTQKLTQTIAQNSANTQSAQDRATQAAHSVEQLEKQLALSTTQAEQLAAQVATGEEKLSQVEQLLAAAEKKNQQAVQSHKSEFVAVSDKLSNAEAKLDNQESKLLSAYSQLKLSEDSLQSVKSELSRQHANQKELIGRYESAESKLAVVSATHEDTLSSFDRLKQSQANHVQITADLHAQITQLQSREQQLSEELKKSADANQLLESNIFRVESKLAESNRSLSNLEQRRLIDVKHLSDVQSELELVKSENVSATANIEELDALKSQVQRLKSEASKYAKFQEDALATARELMESKETIKAMGTQLADADVSKDRLTQSNIEIARLQKELNKANRYKVDLREQSALLVRLQRDNKKYIETSSQAEIDQKRVVELEQQLKAKDVEATKLQSVAEKNAKRDGGRVEKMRDELKASKQRVDNLNKALTKAEKAAKKADENDLELRRLRSELRTVQSARKKSEEALSRVAKQPVKVVDNNARATQATLERLEKEIAKRDEQIERFRIRLADLQKDKETSPIKVKVTGAASDSHKPAKATTALFVVPKEKDDLKKIRGIGPVMEKMLNKLGITSFKQIADFTVQDVQRVSEAIETFPGRVERDDWIGGAKREHKSKYGDKVEA